MERTKKIGVVALLERQRFDNRIHQNCQLLVYFCSLIFVLRSFNQFLAKKISFTFPFRYQLEMQMKFSNLMKSFFANLIPRKSGPMFAEISELKFVFKKPCLYQYLIDSNK